MSRSPLLARSATLAASLLLASCATIPNLGSKPGLRAPETVAASASLPGTAGTQAAWPGDGWWTGYNDPQFTALIEEGLRNSPDVAIAAARFRKASAYAQQAVGPLLPSLDAQGQASLDKQSYNNGFPKVFVPQGWNDRGSAALNLNFDIDLWGKNRAALAAATSDAKAAEIDMQQARLLLTTGIANAYADLARLYAIRDVQQSALDIRTATRKLVADRVASGLDTRGELRQSEAGAATARANLAAADEAIALRRNQIAALIGAGPDRGLSITRPALSGLAAHGLPDGVTTDLIGRRPDIAAARARAQAAAKRIKVARADFFPALSLGAMIGYQSLGLETLFNKDSTYGNAGPAVSLPLFHGGAIRAQYRGARASYDETVAQYDKTVLAAYQEVADVVTSRRMLEQRLADTHAALKASEEAYAIARKRYEGRLSSYLDVLSAEEKLLQSQQAAAEIDVRAFMLDIALIRALGGGFIAQDTLAKDKANG